MYFRPVSPSDRLKMHPWGTTEAMKLGDDVRGKMPHATLWLINDDRLKAAINAGILSWSGTQTSTSALHPWPSNRERSTRVGTPTAALRRAGAFLGRPLDDPLSPLDVDPLHSGSRSCR